MESIDENQTGYPIVPKKAVEQYEKNMTVLLQRVNHSMQSQFTSDAPDWGCKLDMMTDNHKNHLLLTTNAMTLGDQDIVSRNNMWAYQVFQSRGYSPECFIQIGRAFGDAVQKTMEKEDAVPIMEMYDWMLSQYEKMPGQMSVPESDSVSLDDEWEEIRIRFTAALADLDHFKKANDTYDHQTVDQLLVACACLLLDDLINRVDEVYIEQRKMDETVMKYDLLASGFFLY